MKKFQVKRTPLCDMEIESAILYYNKVNKAYAVKFKDDIKSHIQNLRTMANRHSFANIPNSEERNIRQIFIDNYILFFNCDEERGIVILYRFIHSYSDFHSSL